MWSSLKLHLNADPRWPEVPKETRCSRIAGSGCSRKVSRDELWDVDQVTCVGEFASLGTNLHVRASILLFCYLLRHMEGKRQPALAGDSL